MHHHRTISVFILAQVLEKRKKYFSMQYESGCDALQ